jgi:hypothetical protein
MDAITKRSAAISTAIHATLIVIAFWGAQDGPLRQSQLTHQVEETPALPEAPKRDSELILVPESVVGDGESSDLPALPLLSEKQYVLGMDRPPGATVITPGSTERPGRADSAGKRSGSLLEDVDLPTSDRSEQTLSAQLHRRTESQDMDRAGRIRRTAATHLDGRLYSMYRDHWRRFDQAIVNRQIVVCVTVDSRGLVLDAGLANSTGVTELDRLIELWLKKPGLGLPPLQAGVPHYFMVNFK